jgi:hypothetical protein
MCTDIHVLIDGCAQHSATMFPIEPGQVGTTTNKTYPERGTRNDHKDIELEK